MSKSGDSFMGAPKLPIVQSYRALAIIAVLMFHADAFPAGFLGVDIFFAISGFVIFRSVHYQLLGGYFSTRNFYIRRFRRLFPALAVAMFGTSILAFAFSNPISFSKTTQTALAAMFGLGNVVAQMETSDYFSSSAKANWAVHSWSLSVEEQFYLVFPLVVFLSQVLKRRRLLAPSNGDGLLGLFPFFAVSGVISLGTFMIGPMLVAVPVWGSLLGYYSPVTRAWEFILGGLIFMFTLRHSAVSPNPTYTSRLFSTIVFAAAWGAAALLPSITPWSNVTAIQTILVMGAFAFTLAATAKSGVSKHNSLRQILGWIGDRSYSLYLWHYPVFRSLEVGSQESALSDVAAAALLLTLSSFSFRFFESRSRSGNPHFFPLKTVSLSLIGVLIAPLLSALIPNSSLFSEANTRPVVYQKGCHSGEALCSGLEKIELDRIEKTAGATILLVGDSNAAQLHGGLLGASEKLGARLLSFTSSGCPGFSSKNLFSGHDESRCLAYEERLAWVLTQIEPQVLVVGFSDSYFNSPAREKVAEVRSRFLEDFEKFVIRNSGHSRVIVAEPIPTLDWQNGGFNLELLPRELPSKIVIDIGAWNTLSVNHEIIGLGGTVGYETVNVAGSMCDEITCTVYDGEDFFYRDSSHISVSYSLLLLDTWLDILARNLTLERSK